MKSESNIIFGILEFMFTLNFSNIKKALIVISMPFLVSCATYNRKMSKYYSQLDAGNYKQASNTLSSNSFIQTDRNRLLFLLEKGKVQHLMQNYDSSNTYFNLADKYWEDNFKNAADIAKSVLLNPMAEKYLGESFERFMMHYYKALNYSFLGNTSSALVEAKRITLTTNAISDKVSSKKYQKDAFALNLQGILYEIDGDINNAFISYRNAIDIYLANNGNYYGIKTPIQLQKDLIRTAQFMGFDDQISKYQKLFNLKDTTKNQSKNEVIIFIEQGWGPQKKEINLNLVRGLGGLNVFTYTDSDGNGVNIPFYTSNYLNSGLTNNDLLGVRSVRIALPKYAIRYPTELQTTVKINNKIYPTEQVENINSLAVSVLKERYPVEIANAIARQLVKLAIEKAASAASRQVVKNQNQKNQKTNDNAELAGALAGLFINVLTNVTEKAETRNWQSLPAFIDYVRVPLNEGNNTIELTYGNNTKTIQLKSTGNIQILSWNTKQ